MKTQVESETNLKVGGYIINPTTKIPRDILIAFETATKELIGASYKPLILVGRQLVHGTNCKFIALKTIMNRSQLKSLVEIVIHVPLPTEKEKPVVMSDSIKELMTEYEDIDGGWSIVGSTCSYPQRVASALPLFARAGYTPLICAAQQIVAGMNFMIYCSNVDILNPNKRGLVSITIYQNLKEELFINRIENLLWYNKYS